MRFHNRGMAAAAIGLGTLCLSVPALAFKPTYCPGHDPRSNPRDVMMLVGSTCVDKYEASVWTGPRGAGTQYPQGATAPGMRFPATFPENGNWTEPLYATSMPDVGPSTFITWFQAQQACGLAGKRLLTNAEWQMAAAGTPDPGAKGHPSQSCTTNYPNPVPTGTSVGCESRWGVSDMVGNVEEWVADWIQGQGVNDHAIVNVWNPAAFTQTLPAYGDDDVSGINDAYYDNSPQTGGPATIGVNALPGAIVRSGHWLSGSGGGVFQLDATRDPGSLNNAIGFRCGKNAPYVAPRPERDPPRPGEER